MATGSPVPTPSSSRRTSFSTASPSQSPSPARVPPQRRNRAALRDYYGLKATTPLSPSALGAGDKGLGIGVDEGGAEGKKVGEGDGEVKEGEMDREGFNAEEYVRRLLKEESLDGLMRVAGQVVQEIRILDGERKALVYDNYSKLIAATDTIRKMRTNLTPILPTTSTLTPTIAHIAETASHISTALPKYPSTPRSSPTTKADDTKEQQRRTVKWVLDAPRRLAILVQKGETAAAEKDWVEVKNLLETWKGVDGVLEIREECERVIIGGDK